MFFLVIQITNAKNIYVNDSALTGDVYCTAIGNDANSGLTAALPKLTLAAAITAAANGDIIYVDTGTYTGTGNRSLTLNKSITIIGAGSGNTIFDGTNNAVNFGSITVSNFVLKNLTLTKYYLDSSSNGQALNINGAITGVVIENLIVSNNYGGSNSLPNIYISGGASATIKSSFLKCSGFNGPAGGGIKVTASTLVVQNSIFYNNEDSLSGSMGGAIWVNGVSNVTVTNCTFTSNIGKNGGAIGQDGGTLTVTGSCFSDNISESDNSTDGGGAIYITGTSNTNISDCTFSNNRATNVGGNAITADGGAFKFNNVTGTFNISSCSFTNNGKKLDGTTITFDRGQDIYIDEASITNSNISNCTFQTPISGEVNIQNNDLEITDFTSSKILSSSPVSSGGGTPLPVEAVSPTSAPVTSCISTSNISSCSAAAVVCATETTPPVILTCVPNKTVACGTTLADYTSEVSAFDDCSYTVTQSPAAGSSLSGTTTVTMTVTDQKGNATTCTFTVSVASSTWNGTAWSNGTPTAETAVTFTGDFSSTANLFACSVLVTNNASVVINSGHSYTVQNAVTVDSGSTFTFNNNANLIQVNAASNTGNIILKRDTNLLKRLDYTIWSAPVTGQNLLDFSPLTLTNRFYTYNTTNDLYNAVNPSTTNFTPGVGFQIRVPNNHPATTPTVWTGTFTGVPNNGNYSITMSTAGNGYNMVGNPYPSPINLTTFNTVNSANYSGTVWFWRKENSTTTNNVWSTWNSGTFVMASDPGTVGLSDPNNIVRNGQGFLVKATSTTLSFTNAMRSSDTSNQFFRNNSSDLNRIWLNLTNSSGFYSQQAIRYSEGGTNELDRMDAENINNSDVLFTSLRSNNDTKYTIQSRQYPFDVNDVVPLSIKTTVAGSYTIAIDHKDGLFEGESQNIYLKDNFSNTETNLNNGNYTFVSESGVFDNRFELRYIPSLLDNNQNNFENSVIVYQQNEVIHVNSSIESIQNIKIFDIRGRLIHTSENVNSTSTQVKLNIEKQIVLMKITMNNGTVITRKILN